MIPDKRLFLHYKGSLYVVTGTRLNASNHATESDQELIDYAPISPGTSTEFSRPRKEFFDLVKWPDGEKRMRFVQVQDLAHAAYLYRTIF